MQNHQYDPLYLFIDGDWIEAGNRDTVAVINPATEATIGRLPLATAADLERALSATRSGFDVWRHTVPAERARIMKNAAALMRERAEHIASLMTLEEGKPCLKAAMKYCVQPTILNGLRRKHAALMDALYRQIAPAYCNWSKKNPLARLPPSLRGISRPLPRHANYQRHWPQVVA
jgi:acyl-CoA reductase-like NAD-dependent aldehyde dehydrogenase